MELRKTRGEMAADIRSLTAEIARLEQEVRDLAQVVNDGSISRPTLEQRYQRLLKLVEPFVTVGAMFLGSSGWDTKEDVYRAFKVGDLRRLAEFVREG